MTNEELAAENTDREIWRRDIDDHYSPSIHVTEEGAIGIDVGGMVYVKSIEAWHKLAVLDSRPAPESAERVAKTIVEFVNTEVSVACISDRCDFLFNETHTADIARLIEEYAEERAEKAVDQFIESCERPISIDWKKAGELHKRIKGMEDK